MTEIKSNVNQFPSLTWNHLKINRSSFSGVVDTNVKLVRCDPQWNPVPADSTGSTISEKITYDRELCQLHLAASTSIATGLGAEFDSALDSATSVSNDAESMNFFVSDSQGTCAPCSTHNLLLEGKPGENIFADCFIDGLENSNATYLFNVRSPVSDSDTSDTSATSEKKSLVVLRIRANLEERARIHVVVSNTLSSNFEFVFGFGSSVKDSAEIELTELELGAQNTWSGVNHVLEGRESSYVGQNAYIVNSDRFLDMNQICLQKGPETKSKFTVDGVLMDNARKTWRGTIDFKRGCTEAVGDEQEDVLLLDGDVENKSLPVILCDEEAVEGRHGCTIAKLDLENLFYMQSRGVDEKTARNLLVRAKVASVCHHIPDQALVEFILNYVEGAFTK